MESRLRQWWAARCYHRALARLAEYPESEFASSAVVFSPHYDDETLGCGGTIIKKREAGADVRLVFMTDGGRSHAASDIRQTRRTEGDKAGEVLGVSASSVVHLGFAEGHLDRVRDEVTARLAALLTDVRPAEVFVPHEMEPRLWSDDHVTTTDVVLSALDRCGVETIVTEYPIWYWRQWPWTSRKGSPSETLTWAKQSLASRMGAAAFRGMNCRVDVGDVMERKRQALAQHRSQVERLNGDSSWAILADVSGGEFLQCFFSGHEFFRRRVRRARRA